MVSVALCPHAHSQEPIPVDRLERQVTVDGKIKRWKRSALIDPAVGNGIGSAKMNANWDHPMRYQTCRGCYGNGAVEPLTRDFSWSAVFNISEFSEAVGNDGKHWEFPRNFEKVKEPKSEIA